MTSILIVILISISGISVDGQYVNNQFIQGFKEILHRTSPSVYELLVLWDAAHFLNLAVTDVRDGRNGLKKSVYFSRFTERSNKFTLIMGHGKNHAVLETIARTKNLKLHVPQAYATQR